jgi:orotidine-5'-phosphate decarboxylase
VATFSVEDGVRAVRAGAKILVVGMPLIAEPDPEAALRKYVDAVKSA